MPTLWDVIDALSFLRGMTGVYLVGITAVFLVVSSDWRITVFGLAVQSLVVGMLAVDVLLPHLALAIAVTGWFICLILYVTARQVNWGKLPEDVSFAEIARLGLEKRIRAGKYALATDWPFRMFLALFVMAALWLLAQQPGFQLPAVPVHLAHISLAVYLLLGMGVLGMGLTTEPLLAGVAAQMFLSGVVLLYSLLEGAASMLGGLLAGCVLLAVGVAYLVQGQHAILELLD